ncbi:MAG: type II secretion system protein [Candidatus Omnitrophica bacterium]|nr:type II secretion system protein [Candidatus Omnitrophota bacterium]
MSRKQAFTLIELMVVVTIIGILAGISVMTYRNTKERALDREARAALFLVRNAERQYRGRFERFWPSGITVNVLARINGNLSIDLNGANWNYAVTGGASGITYSAAASRSGRTWTIAGTTGNPTCSGSCI